MNFDRNMAMAVAVALAAGKLRPLLKFPKVHWLSSLFIPRGRLTVKNKEGGWG